MSIKPPPQPSPLAEFVATIQLMGRTAYAIRKAVSSVSDWPVVLDDIQMMTTLIGGRTLLGLRTHWARRVAMPIIQAQQALSDDDGPTGARKALKLLMCCADVDVRIRCCTWIRVKYHVD